MNHLRVSFGPVILSILLFLAPMTLTAQNELDDADNVVATYAVRAGVLADKPSADHRKIWSGVVGLVPPSLLHLVETLELFEVPAEMKDAEIVTDAYAVLSEDGQSFTLGLNLTSALAAFVEGNPEDVEAFRQTVIHEFGHVLSFQPSQRDDTATVQGTLVIEEGTLLPQSYLNLFYDRFWKKVYPDHGPTTTSDAEGTALYNKSPASFVSEYAATGPLEDFAETFAFFVTKPAPKGKAVKDQKLKFFAEFPELVKLRVEMRKGMD